MFSNQSLNKISFVDIDSRKHKTIKKFLKKESNRIVYNIAMKYGRDSYSDNLKLA